jgi:hypothetical protein
VFLLDCNPVYIAPRTFLSRMRSASFVFSAPRTVCGRNRSGLSPHLPDLHALEGWGDALAFEERQAYIQPLIQPLYHGISRYVLAAAPKSRS